jgi:hypothetical protein
MKRAISLLPFVGSLLLLFSSFLNSAAQDVQPAGDSFVYADFENVQNNKPFSNRGGNIQLISYEASTPVRFKGAGTSNVPEVVRLKQDDPNRAIAFDYELFPPNQYAGVGVQVEGQPYKDGKPVPEDLSAYKNLLMQVYATGVTSLRLEIISRGQGVNLSSGFPQTNFKVKPGFNTYKVALSNLVQPSWVETRVGTKDVLKKLTALSLTAYCENCTLVKGTVVVDNIVFQK